MNDLDCHNLIEEYVNWLRQGLSVENLDNACELTTPFLDRHNDHIQVYAQKNGNQILLTDDGYILSDLEATGLDINTPKRKTVIESILNGVGVRCDNRNQLFVEASPNNVGQKLHYLIQAMLAVNDMFVMSQPRVATFFWEDIRSFLDEHNVRYSPRVKIAGKSGFDHAIDFIIPRSKEKPERLIQAINDPRKDTIAAYLFTLTDTRESREGESEAYAFLNDTERSISGDVLDALNAYSVKPALWTRRAELVKDLVA
ncbi:MAG: DUF1829 domain-containing protein [Dehalococcoidia bacterium]